MEPHEIWAVGAPLNQVFRRYVNQWGDEAELKLQNDLVLGKIVGIGLLTVNGSTSTEVRALDPKLWIAATLKPDADQAQLGDGAALERIRIVFGENVVLTASDSEDGFPQTSTTNESDCTSSVVFESTEGRSQSDPRQVGRMSRKPQIRAAIIGLLAQNPDWLKLGRQFRQSEIIAEAKRLFSYVKGDPPDGFSMSVCDDCIAEIRDCDGDYSSLELPEN